MKYILAFILALWSMPAYCGQMSLLGAGKVTVASGFTGPLDVISANVIACYSLRACSAALRGNAAVNACNSTGGIDVGCGDLFTNATTGQLVAGTIGGITCPGAN